MTESLAPVPPVARQLNLTAALNALWSTEEMTARDLMDATGLTRATVHAVCNDLIDRGWIRELEPRHADSRRPAGRPSRVFELNREAGYVLGLDVGEAHLGVIVADLAGEPCFNRRFDIARARTRTQRRAYLVRSIDEALRVAGVSRRQLIVAAVGLAAPVSRDGVVGYADDDRNPYWRRFRLDRETLAQALEGTNTLVDNDANLAVLGERWRGVARGVDDLVVLLASERLGAGMMESGRVLRGHYGGAGEMYWLDLVDGIEGAFGFAYLARTWARAALAEGRESALLESADGDPDNITAEMVFEAAAGGDRVATEVIERLAKPVAQIICMMSILLNPRLVVIDGAIARSAGALLPHVDRELARIAHDPPRVMCSTLGDMVVAIGAVRLALDHVQANVLDISPSSLSDGMLRQALAQAPPASPRASPHLASHRESCRRDGRRSQAVAHRRENRAETQPGHAHIDPAGQSSPSTSAPGSSSGSNEFGSPVVLDTAAVGGRVVVGAIRIGGRVLLAWLLGHDPRICAHRPSRIPAAPGT